MSDEADHRAKDDADATGALKRGVLYLIAAFLLFFAGSMLGFAFRSGFVFLVIIPALLFMAFGVVWVLTGIVLAVSAGSERR